MSTIFNYYSRYVTFLVIFIEVNSDDVKVCIIKVFSRSFQIYVGSILNWCLCSFGLLIRFYLAWAVLLVVSVCKDISSSHPRPSSSPNVEAIWRQTRPSRGNPLHAVPELVSASLYPYDRLFEVVLWMSSGVKIIYNFTDLNNLKNIVKHWWRWVASISTVVLFACVQLFILVHYDWLPCCQSYIWTCKYCLHS